MRNDYSKIEEYIISKINESDALKSIRNTAFDEFKDNRKFIQINQIEGKILQLLIKMNNIKTVVELGTLVGYSTLWIAEAVGDDGKVYTIEKDVEHASIAKKNLDVFSNVELLVGDAKEKLHDIEVFAPFDMIFIDADKSGYLDYLDWAEKNIKKNGLIVADNTLLFGTICDTEYSNKGRKSWKVMNVFNERLADSLKYDSIIIPTSEGLTVSVKKY